jgi:hypothetical protein
MVSKNEKESLMKIANKVNKIISMEREINLVNQQQYSKVDMLCA